MPDAARKVGAGAETAKRRLAVALGAFAVAVAAARLLAPPTGLAIRVSERTGGETIFAERGPAPAWIDFADIAAEAEAEGGIRAEWTGTLLTRRAGVYHFDAYATAGGRMRLALDGEAIAGCGQDPPLPGQVARKLEAGRHSLDLVYENDPTTTTRPFANLHWAKEVRAFRPIPEAATRPAGVGAWREWPPRIAWAIAVAAALVAAFSRIEGTRGRRAALRAGFALVAVAMGTAGAIGLVELALRAAGVRPREYVPGDIWLTYRLGVPGATTRYMGYLPYAPKDFETDVTFNSRGWRDKERDPAKPAGVERILVLGDSYVEAKEVAREDAFPQVLERLLNERADGRRYEVVPMGYGGTSTIAQVGFLREQGLAFAPDRVLLCFFPGNDVRENHPELEGEFGKWFAEIYQPKIAASRVECVDRLTLVPGSRLNGVLVEKLCDAYMGSLPLFRNDLARADMTSGDLEVYRVESRDKRWEEAWRISEERILEAKRIAEEAGAKFALVPIFSAQIPGMKAKDLVAGREGYDLDAPYRRLEAFAEREGIETLNLKPVLEADRLATGEPYFFPHDAHWNERGHRIAAEALARFLGGESGVGTD